MDRTPKEPPLSLALVPVVALVAALAFAIRSLDASPHIPIIMASAIVVIIGVGLGHDWRSLQAGMVKGISIGIPSVLILMAIGILVGTWIACGAVPLLIVYGLQLLTPEWFLVASCMVCSIVSLATGSSWSTAGTIGVALIGVGDGLGVSKAMTAGAIVSGAYFGDKLSPLSDTTNLASGVAEVPLFTHIRHMLWTTVPSMLIALTIYAILGRHTTGASDAETVRALVASIESEFRLSPVLLLAPLSVIVCLICRLPALPAILVGAFAGGILALALQGASLAGLFGVMMGGFELTSSLPALNDLLSGGGLESMYSTIALVLCALAFGGLMEATGMLRAIVEAIMKFAINTGRLVLSTLASCLGMNLLAADQYLAVVMPGRMYTDAYSRAGLDRRNLSRCLEDAGTITSPLIPWNSCGATMLGALKVDPFLFAPYAFFNLLCPLVSATLGLTGWTMKRELPETRAPESTAEAIPEESQEK